MVKNFYIFRHGQSSHNLEGRISGHSNNSVLTAEGIDQAYNAADILRNKNIDLIISSPLRRAKQTSQIVSKTTKAPIHFDDGLTEANLGEIEGMKEKQVQKAYGELYDKWYNANPEHVDISFKNGESKKAVKERVFSLLNKYASESSYQNLAVSGHSSTLAQILSTLGINKQKIEHGSIIHLQYQNGGWSFLGFIEE